MVLACFVLVAAALAASAGCGGGCLGFCAGFTPSDILETHNRVVTSATSSCTNVHFDASGVWGEATSTPTTCHVDVTIDDGEAFSLDVAFDFLTKSCCCGKCNEAYIADWQPIVVSGPPSYDASPFPSLDAGDADTLD